MTDAIDNERFVRLAAIALERGRSRALPGPAPARSVSPQRASVPMLRLAPSDGAVDVAIFRISEHSERVEKALTEERQRMDEARNAPRRSTRPVEVESPFGREYRDEQGFRHNRPDRVERIVDTIDLMLRARQIDRGQEAAARKVQDAWALAEAGLRCTLAPSAGGRSGSGTLSDAQIAAGEILNDVRAALGELDAPIVVRVCGMGYSIEETAKIMFALSSSDKVSERHRDHVGLRLRMGLAHLSRRWRIAGKGGAKVVGLRGANAGQENSQNFGALSEAERERFAPLRYAAELRAQRFAKKARRRKPRKAARTEGA